MKHEHGTALVITLLLLTILTAVVVEFAYSVYINTSSLTNWINAQKASLLGRSGQSLISNYINDIKKLLYTEQVEMNLPFSVDMGYEGNIMISVEDENSKFNINNIIYPNGMTNEKALASLKRLLEYLDIDPSLALMIADWIDPDNVPRVAGSETNAKNTYLWSLEELRLINGLGEEVFKNIRPFITIYSDGMININTAEVPVLVSLSDEMTETLAEKIIYYRESASFENKTDIVRVSGLEAIGIKIQDRITVKSSCFKVTTRATVNGITRVIESTIDASGNILYWKET